MLKLIGTFLLAGGGLSLGMGAVQELSRREKTLTSLVSALAILERELHLRAPSTSELFQTLERMASEPAASLFSACRVGLSSLGQLSFQEIWTNALSSLPDLAAEDRETLAELGTALGRYDALEQCRAVTGVRQTLEEIAARLHEQRRREGRAYRAVGLSLGLFAAILLL